MMGNGGNDNERGREVEKEEKSEKGASIEGGRA